MTFNRKKISLTRAYGFHSLTKQDWIEDRYDEESSANDFTMHSKPSSDLFLIEGPKPPTMRLKIPPEPISITYHGYTFPHVQIPPKHLRAEYDRIAQILATQWFRNDFRGDPQDLPHPFAHQKHWAQYHDYFLYRIVKYAYSLSK